MSNIKVTHLIGQLVRGGAERQMLALVAGLRERGWDQTVVTFNPGDVWEDRLTALGVRLTTIPRRSNKLRRLWEFGLAIREDQPDIIHSWSHHTTVYLQRLIRFRNFKRVASLRSIPSTDKHTGEPLPKVPNPRAYAVADCVVSNSRAALEVARAAGIQMRRTRVVGNIIEAAGQAKPGENELVPHIVAVGALIPLKAYDVLIKALGSLAADGLSFKLSIAGAGPDRTRLESLAGENSIFDRITFLGSIENVQALLRTGHLFVHPSRSEGLSNSVLEAMSEGLPVVATRVGGLPEFIQDGRNGYLVAPNEPNELAHRIAQLLVSPGLREEIGRVGLETVRERCSIERVTADHEELYQSLME
jgi:glycosyltransferase involved in cell wall biosynthesis